MASMIGIFMVTRKNTHAILENVTLSYQFSTNYYCANKNDLSYPNLTTANMIDERSLDLTLLLYN